MPPGDLLRRRSRERRQAGGGLLLKNGNNKGNSNSKNSNGNNKVLQCQQRKRLEVLKMARRQAIEPDELFETANRLQAEGKEVTATALLDALGGGSLRTIYKYLEIWKGKTPPVATTRAVVEVPDQVQAGFVAIWKAARQEADRELEGVKQKAAEEVEAANKQFQEALDALEKLEKGAEEAAQEIESLTARTAELTQEVSALAESKASYKATAQHLQQQVKSQELELERLHKGQAEEREKHTAQVLRLEQSTAQVKEKFEKENSDLKAALEDARGKLALSEREKEEMKSANEESRKQLEKVEESANSDRRERDAAVKEAAELKGLSAALKEQNEALLAKIGSSEKPEKKPKP